MLQRHRKALLTFITFCGISFVVLFSLFNAARPLHSHDIEENLNWIQYFSQQVWLGDFYPRWLKGLNYGLGSPAFFYYPPVPYWITNMFYPIKIGGFHEWFQLILSAYLGLVLSGITAYLWLCQFVSRRAAIYGSAIYMLFPYHLAVDLYWRCAFAEYWSFVWLPLILYFVRGVSRAQKFSLVGLAISYSLLILTHLPTTLTFSILPLIYCFCLHSSSLPKLSQLVRVGIGQLLGIGIAAIYLIPALKMQESASIATMFSENLYFANNFLTLNPGLLAEPRTSLTDLKSYLSILGLLLVAIALLASARLARPPQDTARRELRIWQAILLLSILMTTPLSQWVWNAIPLLAKVQFPWRFLTLSTLCVAALSALTIESIAVERMTRFRSLALNALIAIALVVGMFAIRDRARQTLSDRALLSFGIDTPEYRPIQVPAGFFDRDPLMTFSAQTSQVALPGDRPGEVTVERWRPRQIELAVTAKTEATIQVKQFFYSGWQAVRLDTGQSLPLKAASDSGLIQIDIPPGQYRISLVLAAGTAEQLGRGLSFFSLLVVLGILGRNWQISSLSEHKLSSSSDKT